MSEDILVSVEVLAYNQSNYIRQTLDSILMQKTNFKYEILINDDCSTDGTAEIIREYEHKYPDIIKSLYQIENQFSKNISISRNFIFPRVRGKYFAICEGDDYWTDPCKLQKQVDFLEAHPGYIGCFHPVKVIYEDINKKAELYPNNKDVKGRKVFTLDDLLQRNYIQTNSVVYRWRFNEDNVLDSFPENIMPGDWYLHLLHAQKGDIAFLPEVMAVYRRNSGGIWYDSLTNVDNLHLKYGIKEINFYYSVYKNITDCSQEYFEKILLPSTGNILTVFFENQKINEIMNLKNSYPDLFEKVLEFNNTNESAKKKTAKKCAKYKKLFNLFLILTILLAVLNVLQLACLLWFKHIF